ncbi:MAG TPA: Hint domain-containing protein, partial [Acetobacteraceae bacterium]|nr:Hint domain-containing protein [Acetobacteraceae bacterium]
MATRVWANGSGGWSDPAQWSGGVVPLPDDTEMVGGGTVVLPQATLSPTDLLLDGPATLVASGTDFDRYVTIDISGIGMAAFVVAGDVADAGRLDVAGATLEIGNPLSPGTAGALILLNGAQVTADAGGTIALNGTLDNHATITLGAGGTFVNDGTVAQSAAAFEVEAGATLTGSGVFDIGLYSSLYLQSGAAPSAQDVTFTDVGGRLLLGDPASYSGTIENFQLGDLIDLTATVADSASYDAASGLLTVQESGVTVATLHMTGVAGGTVFTATSDGANGTSVQIAGTQTRVAYTIDGGDRAMGANVVRSTMTTNGGAPITGAGVTVGIISDNLDTTAMQAAIQAGYLPASGVDVLSGYAGSGGDEGLAMAELVHQVAPGATLCFASGDGGLGSFASAVTALQQAGCKVIVDDLTYYDEPFFQSAGPLDAAITAAVASGVSYFAAAGNEGSASYQAAYAPQATTLYDGTMTPAEQFAAGSSYQTLTLRGGVTTTITLQWAAPYQAPDPNAMLSMELFDASGNPVATSSPDTVAPESILTFTPTATAQYQLAIFGSVASGTLFKYVLFGAQGGGSTPGGTIDDPAADNAGTVIGHALLPQVNTVAAVDFAATPAFASPASYPEYFSGTGPATPTLAAKPNLIAPDGEATSVAGFAPFFGTSAAAPNAAGVAALMLQADPSLTPAQVSTMLADTARSLGQPQSAQGAGLVQAQGAVRMALTAAACFAEGTRIATARGKVPIERLRRGDRVRLRDGGLAPVRWVGRRHVDCAAHPCPQDVWPVRVAAGAIAAGQPQRDLLLSPDHALLLDGVLIPVRYLLNGRTIRQCPVASVCYWHVELPAHGVVLAEGLPAESYLDTGNRGAFEGEDGPAFADPDLARRIWQTRACAPLVTGGEALARARAHLLARARRLGHAITAESGLR